MVALRISLSLHPALAVMFFFFQAEDGIRDRTVTGVQTCALPISGRCALSWRRRRARPPRTDVRGPWLPPSSWPRSEERRVGKEGRSRWWVYQVKKKECKIIRTADEDRV